MMDRQKAKQEVAVVAVAFDLPLRRTFDYRLKEHEEVAVGCRVVVPFGARLQVGMVVQLKEDSPLSLGKLKGLHRVVDQKALLPQELVSFCTWMAEYYYCSWGEALAAAIPGGFGARIALTYKLAQPALFLKALEKGQEIIKHTQNHNRHNHSRPNHSRHSQALIWQTAETPIEIKPVARALNEQLVKKLQTKLKTGFSNSWWQQQKGGELADRWLRQLVRNGVLKAYNRLSVGRETKKEGWVRLTNQSPQAPQRSALARNPRRETKRVRILRLLHEEGAIPLARVQAVVNNPSQVVHQLVADGSLETWKKDSESKQVANEMPPQAEAFLTLNKEQAVAYQQVKQALNKETASSFLLQGVTGSGKTEVYLHATRHALQQQRSCLILAPEIALSTELVKRFQTRFGKQVVLLHSGLSTKERLESWSRLRDGDALVAIGARSAVFAPLERLGLIVVDEEHDSSYKQEETPRYHARDAAIVRARRHGAVVLLGSATPSMESWHAVKQRKFQLLSLSERVQKKEMPLMQLVDLRQSTRQPGSLFFTNILTNAIRQTLLEKQQVLLFINRRGFASLTTCQACQVPVLCENCALTLTWHQSENALKCHRCAFQRAVPSHCQHCGSDQIKMTGIGIQRIEEEATMLFPQARVLRLDSDVLRRRGELTRLLQAIKMHQFDIIIGTQILAKGHHFPLVTLVGMLMADLSLNLPDFRAPERTFQLLTQMAGRAGRGAVSGKAIIQTYNPQHYSLQSALTHQFLQFSSHELKLRKIAESPPFFHQALVWVEAPQAPQAQALAQQIATDIKKELPRYQPLPTLLGPSPAHIAKVKRFFRFVILLKHPQTKVIRQLLQSLPQKMPHKSRITVDIDPHQLF